MSRAARQRRQGSGVHDAGDPQGCRPVQPVWFQRVHPGPVGRQISIAPLSRAVLNSWISLDTPGLASRCANRSYRRSEVVFTSQARAPPAGFEPAHTAPEAAAAIKRIYVADLAGRLLAWPLAARSFRACSGSWSATRREWFCSESSGPCI